MKHSKLISILAVFVLAFVAVALVTTALPAEAAYAMPLDEPGAAPLDVSYRNPVTLYSGNGITQSANGSGQRLGSYDVADCFVNADIASTQTVTVALDASADNSNWTTVYTYSAISSDSTAYTRTLVYGEYLRAGITLGTANPVTVTVKCVAKNGVYLLR